MFTASFLTQSHRAATGTMPTSCRMFRLRATRRPQPKAFTVGTTPLFDADSMRPLAEKIFAVAPAIADINVVAVEPEQPHLPEVIQPRILSRQAPLSPLKPIGWNLSMLHR
jgi:hypothetical protein